MLSATTTMTTTRAIWLKDADWLAKGHSLKKHDVPTQKSFSKRNSAPKSTVGKRVFFCWVVGQTKAQEPIPNLLRATKQLTDATFYQEDQTSQFANKRDVSRFISNLPVYLAHNLWDSIMPQWTRSVPCKIERRVWLARETPNRVRNALQEAPQLQLMEPNLISIGIAKKENWIKWRFLQKRNRVTQTRALYPFFLQTQTLQVARHRQEEMDVIFNEYGLGRHPTAGCLNVSFAFTFPILFSTSVIHFRSITTSKKNDLRVICQRPLRSSCSCRRSNYPWDKVNSKKRKSSLRSKVFVSKCNTQQSASNQ